MLTWFTLVLLFLSSLPFVSCLRWFNITSPYERGALCNDFTPAGYFVRLNSSSNDWIIFLEGGGGCTSPRKCNERFIDARIRKDFTRVEPNGTITVDVAKAWSSYKPLTVTSRLMTSLWRFSPSSIHSDYNNTWIIQGKDLLSIDPNENPSFYSYNHVLIPYCSSDLFLFATDDYIRALNPNFKFSFDPHANYHHQFTFRGSAIYRSVIQDLLTYHSLGEASDVVLAGSSAGGIGAMNHAQWTQETLSSFTKLSLLTDSSWFINFKNSINKQLLQDDEFFSLSAYENDTCSYPEDPSLCVSAPLIITDPTSYPNIPTFVLFSQYDLYLLTLSILDTSLTNGSSPSNDGGIIELMRIVSEYSGSMVTTREYTSLHFDSLSYYVTSCFHHVYFATSDLWGDAGAILGNEAIDENYGNNRFVHKVQSGVWRSFYLTTNPSNNSSSITIAQAIDKWLKIRYTGQVVGYKDECSGPRCNPHCPEEITLGQVGPLWKLEIRISISLLVFGIMMISCFVRLGFYVWYKIMCKRQTVVIEENAVDTDILLPVEESSNLPCCDEANAISVSCLNVRYSVTVNKSSFNKSTSITPSDAYVAQRYKRLNSVSALVVRTDERHKRKTKESHRETGNNDMMNALREFQLKQLEQGKKKRNFFRHFDEGSAKETTSKKKEILRGISAYFNPGEMVAIMGPSGCGKTTFIDLLAGRQNLGSYRGDIYVNGQPLENIREWYISHTGYVLQLATPYYDSLTVRENLTLSAQMRLPKSYSLNKKLRRVEEILRETGLSSLANTVVGCNIGPGLSGGQKRRLCVALQLLNMPSLIFLDEPTSGLDSSSSLELLTHLNNIASSNRTVILTIHQPRLEIYHMFSQIILLCQGQVAYHGIPENAYQFFLTAHLNATLNINKLKDMESKNPADMIMDMLGSEESRMAILKHYKSTQESKKIAKAVQECRRLSQIEGCRIVKRNKESRPSWFDQLAALEARARKMTTLTHSLYLPMIFFIYGFLLGTVFLSTESATFILTGFGVFSCASGLFMFPAIYNYLFPALQLFVLEYSDGIGSTWQLIFQTFTRFVGISSLPVISGAAIVYLLIIPYTQYRFIVFVLTIIFNLALNFTWIALIMFVITSVPNYAHRISPVLSAIAGFAGGFFIPPSLMPTWYSWLFYINPNYYGFSAIIRTVLADIDIHCNYESSLECYPSTGEYILSYFSLDQINPIFHVLLLLVMTCLFLTLSWLSLLLRHSLPKITIMTKKISNFIKSGSVSSSTNLNVGPESEGEGTIVLSPYVTEDEEDDDRLSDVFEGEAKEEIEEQKQEKEEEENNGDLVPTVSSSSILQGQMHEVWIPGRQSTLRRSFCSKGDIEMRRKSLFQRVSSLSLPDQATLKKRGTKNCIRSSRKEMLELRMKQWNKIEEIEGSGSDKSQNSLVITSEVPPPLNDISTHQITTTKSSLPLENCPIKDCPDAVIANESDDVKKDYKIDSSKVSQTCLAKRNKFVTSLDNEMQKCATTITTGPTPLQSSNILVHSNVIIEEEGECETEV